MVVVSLGITGSPGRGLVADTQEERHIQQRENGPQGKKGRIYNFIILFLYFYFSAYNFLKNIIFLRELNAILDIFISFSLYIVRVGRFTC